MKKNITSHKYFKLFISVSLCIGLLLSIFIFNHIENKKNMFLEITFIEPHKALIFWKTDHKTKGYVTYGTKKKNRTQIIEQTSSTPGEIHTVIIDDIPLAGAYISIHNNSDSKLLWRKPIFITFDPASIE